MIREFLKGISLIAVVVLSWNSTILAQANENHEVIINFNMDTDPGWMIEGQWEYGQPQGAGGDPVSGYTGSNVYGYNLAGKYSNRMPRYYLTTTPIDCSSYTNVVLKFHRWLGVESRSFDHAGIEVSTDGTAWTSVWEHSSGGFTDSSWVEKSYDISSVADGSPVVYIRWGMGTTDGSVTYCGWNIDDVEIVGVSAFDVELSLILPDDVDEGAGTMLGAGQLMVSSAQPTDLVVALSVDEGGELSVPEQLIIPVGQTNVYFDLTVLDDALLNGSRDAWVEASAEACRSGGYSVSIQDNETAVLTLSLPDTTYEGIGLIEGALQVDSPPDNDIQVELRSSDTNEISSCTVVIPAGQTLVPVEFVVVDDEVLDGVKTVVIEAYVDNWTGDACHVFVFDNEQVAVAPPIPEEIEEGSMPWPMYQGNKEHTGYVPVSLVPEKSKELWSKTIGSGRPLNPITVAEGKMYASTRVYFNAEEQLFVLDAMTGEMKWTKNFGRVFSVNPPSYAYGNVYIQIGKGISGGPGSPYLHAFNAESGVEVFKAPFSAQWERYYAPTIEDGVVYVNGGSYGGMYAFDAHSGTQSWFAGLSQYDNWTPTIGPDYVYSYVGGSLSALNKTTGNLEFSISGGGGTMTLVYGGGLALAVNSGRLIAFDTQAQALLWENSDAFKGQPSFRDGVVYALNGNGVSAVSASVNQVVWSWIPAGDTLSQNIIVTDSHLIAGSASMTYMIDLETHQQVWSYPKGGHLSLAEAVLYIASANGDLAAFSVLPRLAIELTDEATEGDGMVHMAGSVMVEDVLPHDLVIDLFSSDSMQVSAIGPVTIPAGQTNAVFDLEIIDNDLLDGSQLVTIGAMSDGYAAATGSLWVHDNESATLSLTLPQSTVEGSGGISGMVNVTPIADRDVVVNLVSDNPEKISGGRVVIKAGDDGAAFTLSVLDNGLIDHLQTATIEARVENWESATASVFIADNETVDIRLVLPSFTMEGDGVATNAGEVVLSGTVLSDVHIMLRSLDSSEVTVPFYVTIPTGQSNAFFNITAVDDDVVDGKQYPIITASALGFIPGSQSMSISDNEFHHFTIAGFNGEDPGYLPVPCSVHAVNIDDEYVNTYSGPAWLSGVLGSDPVAVDPAEAIALTNGLWQGTVTFHGVGDDALIFIDDGEGHVGTNEVSLAGFNIVKMATDWELPYIYMVHRYKSSPNKSMLIWYNTDSGSIEHAVFAGENVTDLTVHYGDNRIYVSNWRRAETRVFDRASKAELETLLLGNDVYKINAAGAGRVITEEEDQWITVRMRDTSTGTSLASRGEREGDGDCSLDGRYYYHTDNNSSGAQLSRFSITNDAFSGEISVKTKNYYGSRNVFVSMDGSRVYNCKHVYDADLNVLLNIGSEIYAASAYGDMVLTSAKAYNGINGAEVYTLPFSTTVMAFSGDQSELLLFNSTSGSITSLATSVIMPIPEPAMVPVPAVGSVVGANLPELSWSGAPAAIAYDVYLGTDSNAVASATTNNVEYLGRRTTTDFQLLEGTLSGNEAYYWRVDVVAFGNAVVGGDIWNFQTASIVVDPHEIVVDGMAASYTQTVSVAIASTVAPVSWTASCTNDWVLLGQTSGTVPTVLDIGVDLSGLAAGEYTAEIEFNDGNVVLRVPVSLSVENMRIVKMATDWTLPYIYMAHTSPTVPNKSRLIWYNTDTDSIEHVVDAGENATDLTVHYGDNRIYVSNWKRAETRVFDRSSKTELEPLLLGGDVYKINAGRVGRVYTEGEDQWITVHARDTVTGTSVASRGEREGDGECSLDGHYYYHTDNNSSGARLSRFDISGDSFASEISVKTKSYYGSRNVFVSMDGSRVYNCKHVYDADLNVLLNIGSEIYAASAYGDMVLTTTKAYNGVNGAEVYTLPFSTSVMAFSGDQSDLLLFNSTSGSITSLATSVIMPIPEPAMIPVPADGSVVGANLPELSWSGAPAAIAYDVYVGTDSNTVALATTNNVEYLGRRTTTDFQLLEGTLSGNETYFWRVDIVAFGNAVVEGDVWNFQTASIAVDPYELVVEGMAASYTQTVSVVIASTVGTPVPWTASCTNDWVLLGQTNGTAPGVLDVGVDLSGLAAGEYTAEIEFNDGNVVLRVPVSLSVENMRIVKMATDWTLPYIYMAHTSSTVPNKSRLIWYNTDTDSIEHVIDAGENATDLTVHYGDNRIYVSNWGRAETRVFDRSAKTEIEPLLLGGDVYKINAAGVGRVITEEEDQWIYVRMHDTATGAELVRRHDREGDGECTLDGRFYYRCDNNISNARLYKYNVASNTFASVTSVRTKSYYGSRNVLVSMDGNRVYNCGSIYDGDLHELLNIGSEIYAASAYGDMVLTSTKAYNGVSGEEVYTLPFSTSVMAFSGDQSSLVLFNSSDGTLTRLDTSDIMPLPIPAALEGTDEYVAWQEGYFPNMEMSADVDFDMDGQCNLDEYIAGTDPTSSDSCFVMHDALPLSDGRMAIYWDSVTGRVYSVYWTPSLTVPFQLLDSDIFYPQSSYTDQVERVEQCNFYKIGVELE